MHKKRRRKALLAVCPSGCEISGPARRDISALQWYYPGLVQYFARSRAPPKTTTVHDSVPDFRPYLESPYNTHIQTSNRPLCRLTTKVPSLYARAKDEMFPPGLAPQVHFLSDAAHLLSRSAPETSAFLMRRRNDLLVDNDAAALLSADAQRLHACCCCGHVLTPGGAAGRGDVLEIKTGRAQARRTGGRRPRTQKTAAAATAPSSPRNGAGVAKVVTCGTCSRRTRVQLEAPSRISRGAGKKATASTPYRAPQLGSSSSNIDSNSGSINTKQTAQKTATGSAHKDKAVVSSASASSKKRARNRKAGLQALLDQKQQAGSSSSSGLGLSLKDFMMK